MSESLDVQRLSAGANLSHIRGEVCKALRAGAGWIELRALLVAEQTARNALAELFPQHPVNERSTQ